MEGAPTKFDPAANYKTSADTLILLLAMLCVVQVFAFLRNALLQYSTQKHCFQFQQDFNSLSKATFMVTKILMFNFTSFSEL